MNQLRRSVYDRLDIIGKRIDHIGKKVPTNEKLVEETKESRGEY